ncbi:HAMP domain-containing sensor histidine kinase [Pseudonocardia eucalypti]|uniref:histidine kinase n=1 Tax=Pseudonocardia eucalypti TaxID=648755 RepID=A0ABP9Q7N6_9PSEU|nr:two-component system OmpR family sensor kinase [Pseudonocardia eucalypti]
MNGPASWRGRVAALPLRTRLLVAMIALFSVMSLVVGAISLVLLRDHLIDQLDLQLQGVGNRVVQAYSHPPDGEHHSVPDGNGPYFLRASGLPVGTLGARIKDDEVRPAGVIDEDGVSRVTDEEANRDLLDVPSDGDQHTRQVGDLGEYRLYAVQRSSDRTMIVGLPLESVNTTLANLARIEITVAAVGLVVAGLASTLIVRRALRPLRRVAATAGRVAELRLDRGEVALAERVAPADTDPRTEVGQVGNALNRMLEHVEAALEARHASETQLRQFLADASHELRTPLAAIRGYAELTTRRAGGGPGDDVPEDVAHALRRVSSQAERMTSLVEDMLLLARLDAGRPLAREPVDLSQLVVDAVSDAHAAGPDHRWRLALPDEAVTVTGDAPRLSQVLANLLANARVHTPPGTTVRAELAAAPSGAWLRVIDDGPGIPPGLLPHVFGRFARGDSSRSRAAGSTGLGLAIAQAVVIAHAGQIGVRSAPGGTEFTVYLPTNGHHHPGS